MCVRLVILFYAFYANVYSTGASCNLDGYYWREYHGSKIPKDAFIAGQDLDNENIYIAQTFINEGYVSGLAIASLQANFKEVKVSLHGVQTSKNNIKVLCGLQENFKWLKANATHVHLNLIETQPVIGGFWHNRGKLYIGRLSVYGSVKIGKINGYAVGSANFSYADENKEHWAIPSYEVLTYKSQASLDIDIRIFNLTRIVKYYDAVHRNTTPCAASSGDIRWNVE